MLKRSSPRNCKMTFIIGRGFAGCQILKKWKRPYLLNWVEYFDKLLCKHWHWQDLAQAIAKWHLLSVEALLSSEFWKSENRPICRTVKSIMKNICIHTDIGRCSPRDCQMSFGIGQGVAEVQTLKNSEIGPISWNFLNILIKLCINIAIDVS